MTVDVATLNDVADDVSTTAGGPFNAEWPNVSLHCGFHKSGFARGPWLKFANPGIAVGSVINSASLTGQTHAVTGVGPVSTNIELINEDGKWDAASIPAGWTGSDSIFDWHAELLDGVTQLVITGPAASATIFGPVLTGDAGATLQRMAQGVEIVTGGDIITARVSLGGSFVPGTGDVWVEIWSDSGGLPDVMLGVSATRPISDIAPKLLAELRPTYDFTFSGGDIVTVSALDLVHVVMRTDVVGGAGVHLGSPAYDYLPGDLVPYGTSPAGGFDQQNYLTVGDLFDIAETTAPVAWSITTTIGVKVSPDISSLITARLAQGGYNSSSPLGLHIDALAPNNGEVIFGAYPGTVAPQFFMDLDWTPPAAARRRVRLIS